MKKSFWDYFVEYWNEKRYFLCISTVILLILCGVAAVFLLVELFDFISRNYEKVFLACAILISVFYYIKEYFEEKRQARKQELEMAMKMQEAADKDTIERNYRLIRNCLYSVIRDMSDVMGVKIPSREGEIDSPNHTIRKLNFVLYQYIVYRTSASADTETIRSILRQEISRRLDGHLFAGISQTYYLHDGQAEPIISVYTVEDNHAYFTISVAIADENYCRHIRQGVSLNLLQQAEQLQALPHDNDF